MNPEDFFLDLLDDSENDMAAASDDGIEFASEEIEFSLGEAEEERTRRWLNHLAANEGSKIKTLSYVFCSDEYLLELNKEYLNHDTYTDIITFPFKEGKTLGADIFISIERVGENAKTFGVSFENELRRVMAHGVLHLIGYGDKTAAEQKVMRKKEEEWIAYYPNA